MYILHKATFFYMVQSSLKSHINNTAANLKRRVRRNNVSLNTFEKGKKFIIINSFQQIINVNITWATVVLGHLPQLPDIHLDKH